MEKASGTPLNHISTLLSVERDTASVYVSTIYKGSTERMIELAGSALAAALDNAVNMDRCWEI